MNAADTAFVLISAALVLFMTPGLGLFYGGMVRSKNILGTLMHSYVLIGLISVEWAVIGYSLAFGPDHGGLIGGISTERPGLLVGGQEPPHLGVVMYVAALSTSPVVFIGTPRLVPFTSSRRPCRAAALVTGGARMPPAISPWLSAARMAGCDPPDGAIVT